LHGGEVAVDEHVEQPVQQERDAVCGQFLLLVPALDQGVDVEAVVFAYGDQRGRGDKCGELAGAQPAGAGVEFGGVGRQQQMVVVAIQLRTFVVVYRVFDGQLVQPELLGEDGEVVDLWVVEIQPDRGVALRQPLFDLSRRESPRPPSAPSR
jgi:hypothetical protein